MRTSSRAERLARWSCTAVAALLLACCLLPVALEVDLAESHTLAITQGNLAVILWAGPRATVDPELYGPDTVNLPLWPLVALAALPAAALWWRRRRFPRHRGCAGRTALDIAAARRAMG